MQQVNKNFWQWSKFRSIKKLVVFASVQGSTSFKKSIQMKRFKFKI